MSRPWPARQNGRGEEGHGARAGIGIRRQRWLCVSPYLPRFMAGGPGNPLGARAMYLGETEYQIHGTNKPDTIGKRGFVRLHPADQ